MTMSMLALVTQAYGGRGGIAQYNRDLVEALGGQPSPVTSIEILPRLGNRDTASPSASVRQLPATRGRAAYAARAFYRALRQRPSVVFCGHLYMAPLAVSVARTVGARLVIQLHGVEIWDRPSAAQRRALEAAALVICVSRDTRARALAWAPIPPERAVVVSNTVSENFTPGDRAAARARFDVQDDEFVILSVGRLDIRERYKGQDRVINQLAQLSAPPGRRLCYLVAGDGNDRRRLEELARKNQVLDRVRFMGFVGRSCLPDLYRASDLFALPSTGEGFGIVFLEAMACGTPAIGLNAGGAADALADGELGWCVETDAFPQALRAAISTPRHNRQVLSHKIHERFGRRRFRQRLLDVFSSLENAS